MSVKDIRSQLIQIMAGIVAVVGNGTTDTEIIDNAQNELGLMFGVNISNFTDGVYDLIIRESDDPGFAGSTVVPAEKIIGGDIVGLAAATVPGDPMPTVGVFSNKRYVRAVVQATGVTTGADVTVVCTQKTEYQPVPDNA